MSDLENESEPAADEHADAAAPNIPAGKAPSATAISRRIAPGGGGGGAWLGGPKTASSEKFGNTGKKQDFHLLGTNLFGEELKPDVSGVIREKFDFPPFSVLNAREGAWQERKRAWINIGIKSEVGRGDNLLKMSDTLLEPDPEKRSRMGKTFGMGLGASAENGWEQEDDKGSGTSIFDPVLAELCYKWFCPPGGMIVDPFAGGSVRGIVAGMLGFQYHGIDLRPEQIAANEAQRQAICPEAPISWVVGDSGIMLPHAPEADFIFSCPPYGDLEQYSDDPNDLSAMTWEGFVGMYRHIIRKSVERLKPNRFACFVIGEYRDKQTGLYRGFVPLTCASFMAAGAALYNEAILITSVGSLALRVTKQFETTRKMGKTHQNIIICVKGDPKIATDLIMGRSSGAAAPAPMRPATASTAAPAPAPPAAAPAWVPPAKAAPAPAASGGAMAVADVPVARVEVSAPSSGSMAEFLGTAPARLDPNWRPDEPPDLSGIDEVILNFATTGLNWVGGDRPCGVTVSTMDGKLTRFLPFGFQGGNLDEATVKRWAQEQLKNKKITNSKTKFDIHMSREWGVDLEAQGCRFSDIQHTAALLDDHRKRFSLDVLAADYFPGERFEVRADETQHSNYHAGSIAAREIETARLVGRLRDVMYPEIEKQELRAVHDLEDAVIPCVVEMEKNGSPIDMELLERYGAECCAAREALLMEISQEVGFAFEHTATGWKRLLEALHLVVPDSFNEAVLNEVDHPLVRKGQRASQYASLNSKIFKAYPEHIRDGILRYSINQLASDEGGTVSGRFSIGLVQQVPNEDNHRAAFGDELYPRRLFIPGEGLYLEGDAAQIEFRELVHYSGNEALIQAYRDDPEMSFHRKMQEMLQKYKPDMLYAHTKNYNFAAQYGAKSIKLAVMMGFITAREGDEIRAAKRWNDPRLNLIHEIEAAYKRAHPEAGALLDRASHLAKTKCDEFCRRGDALHRQFPHRGYVKTLLGRRSRFPTNYKTYIGLNRVLQGTGADIMKQKLVELHAVRKETGFVMRITNHDAVLGDATQPETLARVSEVLNRQSFDLKVPIIWKVGTGANWAEAK